MNVVKTRISIVIPVYNEAETLSACLEAIGRMTVVPFEVIVVDNNSEDGTVRIASMYPFVRLLHEPRQGVVHARNRGFDAARGEIIGRIDADTLLDPDWTVRVLAIMQDSSIAAVSGSISYHDLPWHDSLSRLELSFRQRIANGMGRECFLQGANMAIRRSRWQLVRTRLCAEKGLHEDFDLAVHLHDAEQKVIFDPSLHANLSLRRFDTTYLDFIRYAIQNPKTYAVHGRASQRHMYPVIAFVIAFYVPIKLLYRGYDSTTDRFSLGKLVSAPSQARVNPASFVD